MEFYDIEMYEVSDEEYELMGEPIPVGEFDPNDDIPY